eukprot:TRINITY_DN18293_c1_g2_i1.p2 TRINITY_DN18293_c1_g2~~TRINITY_DN18293_c1_g2_i1.p2  ORF type:complete len:137 (-),score=3.33 TRINITY_DN18293_c1_g2_i1:255-665(-)
MMRMLKWCQQNHNLAGHHGLIFTALSEGTRVQRLYSMHLLGAYKGVTSAVVRASCCARPRSAFARKKKRGLVGFVFVFCPLPLADEHREEAALEVVEKELSKSSVLRLLKARKRSLMLCQAELFVRSESVAGLERS